LKKGLCQDIVFIAVGTPARRGDGHADLTYVYAAAEEIAGYIKDYTVIVTKSTVPVGTGDEVENIIRKTSPDASFDVASNPEFLREGAAIDDFKRPDRVVVGAQSEQAFVAMHELYRPLYLNETPLDLCDAVGANVQQVAKGIGLDNRIGSKFLHAGPGYGGSCFPKDTLALSKTAQDYGAPVSIVPTPMICGMRQAWLLFLVCKHWAPKLEHMIQKVWKKHLPCLRMLNFVMMLIMR